MRHLLISYHTSPEERPGTGLAGGMNVLLKGFLAHTSWPTCVVTRSLGSEPEQLQLSPQVTLHKLPCGTAGEWTRDEAWRCLPEFANSLRAFLQERPPFEVVSAHYWMSGWLLARLGLAGGIIFHTLQAQKGDPSPTAREDSDSLTPHRAFWESHLIGRYPSAFLHWHDLDNARAHYPALRASVVRPGLTFPPGEARPPDGPPWIMGWAARNDPVKKLQDALGWLDAQRAAGRDFRLLVAGMSGVDSDRLRYLGTLDHDQMGVFYQQIHQLLNFSSYETFGLSVLEALAAGATVGLRPTSDWTRRLRRLGIPSEPGHLDHVGSRAGLALAACYTWPRALPSWERWLRGLAHARPAAGSAQIGK